MVQDGGGGLWWCKAPAGDSMVVREMTNDQCDGKQQNVRVMAMATTIIAFSFFAFGLSLFCFFTFHEPVRFNQTNWVTDFYPKLSESDRFIPILLHDRSLEQLGSASRPVHQFIGPADRSKLIFITIILIWLGFNQIEYIIILILL